MTKKTKQMLEKHRRFCHEYMKDLNATQAAIRVGYSARSANKTGWEILHNEDNQKYITKLREELIERTQFDDEWMLCKLDEVRRRSMVAEPVLDHKGRETGDYKFDSSGANRALENIGKHTGFFKDSPLGKLDVGLTVTHKLFDPPKEDD